MTTDTRDPVAALEDVSAQCRCLPIQPGGPCGCRCHGDKAEQGYVLVNAEGLAAAMASVLPGGPWMTKKYAAAILAAIKEQT